MLHMGHRPTAELSIQIGKHYNIGVLEIDIICTKTKMVINNFDKLQILIDTYL